jgi:hypothetical protein
MTARRQQTQTHHKVQEASNDPRVLRFQQHLKFKYMGGVKGNYGMEKGTAKKAMVDRAF